jgi:two-component system response regulator
MINILLVEDSIEDAKLIIRALNQIKAHDKIHHLEDGQEALDYLFQPDSPLPQLIIMDLKMPRVDGLEVLRRLKADERRKVIPVVMLTSSKEEQDIINSYQLGVNAYIVKPVDFHKFTSTVSSLGSFWLSVNQPPAQPKSQPKS